MIMLTSTTPLKLLRAHFASTIRRTTNASRTRSVNAVVRSFSSPSSADDTRDTSLVNWSVDEQTRVGTMTLNSPSTYNALTVEMGNVFSRLCSDIKYDLTLGKQECNAIVLEGAGTQAFSAGGDFEWLRSLRNNSVHENADLMYHFYKSFLCVRTIPVPIIAALNGPAIGAGAGLALACDMRTALDGHPRILGFNFARLGIHSGMGGSHLLKQALGGRCGIMNEILLTGKILSGKECYDLGLVNRLSDDAKASAYELAGEIASDQRHAVAVRTMTQTLRQHQDEGLEAALQREALAQALCYRRNDWGEGVNAIADKRDPKFDDYHEH